MWYQYKLIGPFLKKIISFGQNQKEEHEKMKEKWTSNEKHWEHYKNKVIELWSVLARKIMTETKF